MTQSDAVAFAFVPQVIESANADAAQNRSNSFVQVFKTATDCRRALACAAADVQVVITGSCAEVSPLNLAAALHKDNSSRDIYLEQSQSGGLLISKAGAAGVRGVVTNNQTQELLCLPVGCIETKDQNNVGENADCTSSSQGAAGGDLPVEPCLHPEPELELSDRPTNSEPVGVPTGDSADDSVDAPTGAGVPADISTGSPADAPAGSPADAPTGVGVPTGSPAGAPADAPAGAPAEIPTGSPADEPVSIPASTNIDLSWLDDLLDLDEMDNPNLPQPTVNNAVPAIAQAAVQSVVQPDEQPLSQPVAQSVAQPTAQTTVVLERPQLQNKPSLHKKTRISPQSKPIVDEGSRAKAIAFVSGRGGVGKSTLALLCAVTLWKGGKRVALLDLDLQFGDLSYLAGNEPQLQILRLDGEALLQGQICLPELGKELLLIESPAQPEMAEDLVEQVPELLKLLKQTADIVIINTSCLWNEVLAVLCQSCEQLVFVMDQRSTSVHGCRQAVDLCIRLQIPSTHFNYVLNRCSRTAPITDIDAALAMGGAEVASVADGGAEVDELLSLGCPMELLHSSSAFVTSVVQLTELLEGAE